MVWRRLSGSLGAARNLEGLRKRNVTHIVNASPIVPCFFRGHFRYKALPVYDDAEEDIARFFADATRFIARVRCPFLSRQSSSASTGAPRVCRARSGTNARKSTKAALAGI